MAQPPIFGTDLFGNPIKAPPGAKPKGILAQRFSMPPFSIMNAREGHWQTRKRAWILMGIQSELGRGGNLLSISDSCEEYRTRSGDYAERTEELGPMPSASLKDGLTFGLTQNPYADPEKVKEKRRRKADAEDDTLLSRGDIGLRDAVSGHSRVQGPSQPGLTHHLTIGAYKHRGKEVSAADCGTSIFDPVLCEMMYTWFCPPNGIILDPFAGGSVRGIVAGVLGYRYWGSELSENQVRANIIQGEEILGQDPKHPVVEWVCGDSAKTLRKAPDADFVFSCPPYADLEVYSKDPQDLSYIARKDYGKFRELYDDIIDQACQALRPNRFACFVVGDVRDGDGNYRNFPSHTISAFRRAGLELYNQAILVTAVGSLSIRVARQFEKSRKMGTTHQVVQIFVKGDPRRATEAITGGENGKSDA